MSDEHVPESCHMTHLQHWDPFATPFSHGFQLPPWLQAFFFFFFSGYFSGWNIPSPFRTQASSPLPHFSTKFRFLARVHNSVFQTCTLASTVRCTFYTQVNAHVSICIHTPCIHMIETNVPQNNPSPH